MLIKKERLNPCSRNKRDIRRPKANIKKTVFQRNALKKKKADNITITFISRPKEKWRQREEPNWTNKWRRDEERLSKMLHKQTVAEVGGGGQEGLLPHSLSPQPCC